MQATSMNNPAKTSADEANVSDTETSQPAKPYDRRYINRVGPDDRMGWNVYIRRAGQSFRKRFADSKHGGEEGALMAAKAWRDDIDRLYPAMNKEQHVAAKKNPVSGKRGVCRSSLCQTRKDGSSLLCFFWDAASPAWQKPTRHRRFSVAKYGEDEAFRLAVAAREAFETAAEVAGKQPFRTEQPCKKNARMRNINRVGHMSDSEVAWNVIIKRANLAAPLNKRFADSVYGDQVASLKAAQIWRDEMERQHPRLDHKARLARPTKASTSGVKGVFQQLTPRLLADGSTRVSTFWSAKSPTGVVPQRTRSFSIDKYGEREAFRMAVEARKAFEALLPE